MTQVPDSQAPNPEEILGVPPDASAEEIRAAYLRKVHEFPPDREPEAFERVRDAYALLSDRRWRAQRLLVSENPMEPLVKLLDNFKPTRSHVGPKPWMAALKEK